MHPIIVKILLVGFLFVCFSFQGLSDEKIYSSVYEVPSSVNSLLKVNKSTIDLDNKKLKFKYKEPNINLFLISLLSVIISGSIIYSRNMKSKLFSIKDKMILASLYTIGKYSCENSYQYMDYITKTIAKSAKSLMIAVIDLLSNLPIFSIIISKIIGIKKKSNKFELYDVFKGLVCMASIVLFSYNPNEANNKTKNLDYLYYGYLLIIVSLLSDGLLGLKEKTIKEEVKSNPGFEEYKNMISWYFMLYLNLGTVIILGSIFVYRFIVDDLFNDNILIYSYCTELQNDILTSICFALLAQITVFQILQRYGPLSLSIYTGCRKIISICLSIIVYNKNVSTLQKFSLFLGISVMIIEIFEKVGKDNQNSIKSQSNKSIISNKSKKH